MKLDKTILQSVCNCASILDSLKHQVLLNSLFRASNRLLLIQKKKKVNARTKNIRDSYPFFFYCWMKIKGRKVRSCLDRKSSATEKNVL